MTETAPTKAANSAVWLVVIAASFGAFTVAYNTTAVMTALPAMKKDLDLGIDTSQWVINAYMLAAASSLAAVGHAADRFGLLRIFVIGIFVFALGSIFIAFAEDAIVLLAGRALQGASVAALLGTSVAMVSVATPEERRTKMQGVWGAFVAFGFALGPLIGGALTDTTGWRSIFVLDLVILAIAALLCFLVARRHLVPAALEKGTRVDFVGIGLLFIALSAFLIGLTAGPLYGWAGTRTLGLFALALVGACAFIWRELKAQDPLLNFAFFRHAHYVASASCMFIHGVTQMGVLLFFNLYLQSASGLGFSAGQAGLAMLPLTGVMLAVSLIAPRLLPAGSFRWPLVFGMCALVLGYWLLRDMGPDTPYGTLWWKLMIVGLGIGINWSLLPRLGLSVLPDAAAGQGAGFLNTCLFVGLATGTAAGGVLMAEMKHSLVPRVVAELMPDAAGHIGSVVKTLVHGSHTAVAKLLAGLPQGHVAKIEQAVHRGASDGFTAVNYLMAGTAVVGVILCLILIRAKSAKA